MLELKEMQFEFLPHAESQDGVGFGIGLEVSVDAEGFSPGGPEYVTQDGANPHNGATAFGIDHVTSTNWQWGAHVNREDTEGAVESLGRLASAWRANLVRRMPGEVCAVRYRLAGRDRRIFGRPRRFEYSPNNLILNGYTSVDMEFKPSDANTYDDLESVVKVGLSTGTSQGGFIFPVVFPISTIPPGDNDVAALVGGDVETYPIIRFDGPIISPSLETSKWSIDLDLTLVDGEYVEVDTRPWVQSIMLNGTASVAGALGRRQWLSEMYFEPGEHDMILRGTGAGANTACEVRWRSAWSSI